MEIQLDQLILSCGDWFQKRHIDSAVVGFSGGIDSAFTSALLGLCGVHVHLAVVESPNQKYSSSFGGASGARQFAASIGLKASVHSLQYQFIFSDDSSNEAAAPIQRVAGFYGVCAGLRAGGSSAVVVGTANFDEAGYLGFWGKASDGAQDFYPISHLHKSEIFEFARGLSFPSEILHAVPSGDLLFRQTNDFEMMGASYDQVESIALAAEKGASDSELKSLILSVASLSQFCRQIVSNGFKYELPFGGFHLSSRLENFRQSHYQKIFRLAESLAKSLVEPR